MMGKLILLFAFFVRASLCDDGKPILEDNLSLTKPFYQESSWDISGSTMITDKYIRLTPDQRSQRGSIWSKIPVRAPYWEVVLSFRVHGRGKTLFGDGFALWYTQDRMSQGQVFGSKNGFRGLGVFFDTYSNHQGEHNHAHPFVSAMVSNGSLLYDHDSDGTHTQLDGCHLPFRNSENDVAVKIRYWKDKLEVHSDLENNGETWKRCFESEGVLLPVNYYFGMSAVTGDLSDNHDIMSFKVFSLSGGIAHLKTLGLHELSLPRSVPRAEKFDAPRKHVQSSDSVLSSTLRSPLRTFLVSVVIIVGAIFLTAVGYLFYKDRQEKQLKRFY